MDQEYDVRQRLSEVNKAIQAVLLGGQSYRIGNQSVSRASIEQLLRMRDDLEAQLAAADSSPLLSDTSVGVFEGR